MERVEVSSFESVGFASSNLQPKLSSGERRLERKVQRHAERRKEILQAAQQLLLKEGVQGLTIAAVAKAAGVSKPAVYYYFESKEEVVAGLAQEALRDEASAMERALSTGEEPAQTLEHGLRSVVAHHLSNPESFKVLDVWTRVFGVTAEELGSNHQRAAVLLAARLGQNEAGDRDVTSLARLTVMTAQNIASRVIAGTISSREAEELCQMACSSYRRVLS